MRLKQIHLLWFVFSVFRFFSFGSAQLRTRLLEQFREFSKILHDGGLERHLMQRRSRMVHGDHKAVAHFAHLPMDLGDLRRLEEQAHRETTEGHNDTRVDDLNLVLKIIARANLNLVR